MQRLIRYIKSLLMTKEELTLSLPLRNRLYVSHMNNIGGIR
jgi:hypothetical protein